MDPKTLLILFLVFAGTGTTVTGIMKNVGLIKTVIVTGGNTAHVAFILASMSSAIGWAILIYTIMFHVDVFIRAFVFIFGG